jgi:hypothetical protein
MFLGGLLLVVTIICLNACLHKVKSEKLLQDGVCDFALGATGILLLPLFVCCSPMFPSLVCLMLVASPFAGGLAVYLFPMLRRRGGNIVVLGCRQHQSQELLDYVGRLTKNS